MGDALAAGVPGDRSGSNGLFLFLYAHAFRDLATGEYQPAADLAAIIDICTGNSRRHMRTFCQDGICAKQPVLDARAAGFGNGTGERLPGGAKL